MSENVLSMIYSNPYVPILIEKSLFSLNVKYKEHERWKSRVISRLSYCDFNILSG